MRKLATLALLALSLLTVACTESEDTDFETAQIDEVEGLEMGDEAEGFSERAPAALQAKVDRLSDASRPIRPGTAPSNEPVADRVNAGSARPAHAPSGEPLTDRVGAAALATAPGQAGTGTAECVTELKLQNGEPVVGAATVNAGQLARARYEQLSRVKGIR